MQAEPWMHSISAHLSLPQLHLTSLELRSIVSYVLRKEMKIGYFNNCGVFNPLVEVLYFLTVMDPHTSGSMQSISLD